MCLLSKLVILTKNVNKQLKYKQTAEHVNKQLNSNLKRKQTAEIRN